MGVVLREAWSKSQRTALMRYLTISTNVKRYEAHHSPEFSANVRCRQTAGGTKMPLGMEVGLGPGDFVFDRDLARPRKK